MQRIPTLSEADISLFELKTRFVRNYLTFAGKNSKDFLLYISGPGVYNSPAVDMELQSVPGRNGDLKSKGLVRFVYDCCGWRKKLTYRIAGKRYTPDKCLVYFDLREAFEIHEGRLKEAR